MKQYDFENNNLPKVNPNEDLETISNNFFRPLFDVAKFEIRSETFRDKGIDFHIELKKEQSPGNSVYTNFRFAVQLKATKSVRANADNSFSIPISTSNINYLLNNGMPAFYVFFHKPTNSFYYENVNNFAVELLKKDSDWNKKEKHSLRFSQVLDASAVSKIYQETLDNGILFRRLNQHLKFSASENKPQGVLIDTDNAVYSVAENIQYIDQYGSYFINMNYFNHIIEIEKRTHPRQGATPSFNLFCGLAYFQRGNLYKAMELLKLAQQESESFEPDVRAMLTHAILNGKYLLGVTNKIEFDDAVKKLNASEDSGTFFQVEKAYDELSKSRIPAIESMQTFYDTVKDIIKNEQSPQMRIIVYSKVIAAESVILFHDLTDNFAFFIGRVKEPLKSATYLEWIELESEFLNRIELLKEYSIQCEYYIGACNMTLALIKWNYERTINIHLLTNWHDRAFDLTKVIDQESLDILLADCENLDKIANTYEMLEYRNNMIACFVLKFQILHFAGKSDEAEATKRQVCQIMDSYEFVGLKEDYEDILNGKTTYEAFISKHEHHFNVVQDSAAQVGIDIDSIPESMFLAKKPEWSLPQFLELILPE